MENGNPENIVVLGYHSPTEWVFFPEVVALYDTIIMNGVVFDNSVQKGEHSLSGYESAKAQLLKELNSMGILRPQQYPASDDQHRKLESIVDYFFMNHESEMRQMLVYAFDAFIGHEKATLEKLVSPEDPHWRDVASQLPRLEKIRTALAQGEPLSDFPQLRSIVKRYFEDCILTPAIFTSGYNPVFQWEGYGRFEEFLLCFRVSKAKQKNGIKKGTVLKVLKSISEVVVPFRVIRNPKEMERMTRKWKAFTSIRQYVTRMNRELWEVIDGYHERDENKQHEFVNDFNLMLQMRIAILNRQIEEIDIDVERNRSSFFSKIVRFIIATLGSIIPGTAGFSQVLDDVHANLIRRQVKERYPALRAVFEYESLVNTLELSGKPIAPISRILNEYKPVEYWDQK